MARIRNFVYALIVMYLVGIVVAQVNTYNLIEIPITATITIVFWFIVCFVVLVLGMSLLLEKL